MYHHVSTMCIILYPQPVCIFFVQLLLKFSKFSDKKTHCSGRDVSAGSRNVEQEHQREAAQRAPYHHVPVPPLWRLEECHARLQVGSTLSKLSTKIYKKFKGAGGRWGSSLACGLHSNWNCPTSMQGGNPMPGECKSCRGFSI